jgi:hypothetical protein
MGQSTGLIYVGGKLGGVAEERNAATIFGRSMKMNNIIG